MCLQDLGAVLHNRHKVSLDTGCAAIPTLDVGRLDWAQLGRWQIPRLHAHCKPVAVTGHTSSIAQPAFPLPDAVSDLSHLQHSRMPAILLTASVTPPPPTPTHPVSEPPPQLRLLLALLLSCTITSSVTLTCRGGTSCSQQAQEACSEQCIPQQFSLPYAQRAPYITCIPRSSPAEHDQTPQGA
jgi:hypothetical protein